MLVRPALVTEDDAVEQEIRYARNGGVAIAYQVVGAGGVDLVWVPGFGSNLVYNWESPHWRGFFERLAQTFRLILLDKRGTGLSDHGSQFATLETRMEDLRAVLDATGASNAVVFGAHEGCGMAALYAATYPERTRALALFHPRVRWPLAERETQEMLSNIRERWGTQEHADEFLQAGGSSLYSSDEYRRWFTNSLRVNMTPAVAYALHRAFRRDRSQRRAAGRAHAGARPSPLES